MSKKIILSEAQSKKLFSSILQEQTQTQLVQKIANFLDKHYEKGVETKLDASGNFTDNIVIGVKTSGEDGKDVIATNISPQDLFWKIEDVFKNDIEKGEKRDMFLKQVIMDWYNSKITPEGVLSKNLTI